MKAFLILSVICFAACDKLDRTYLPPPGSGTAGGDPGDLNLPLEFAKNYPSTLVPGITSNVKESSRPNYPNAAFGVDRQIPILSTAASVTSRPIAGQSKNVFGVPTTTTAYAFTTTTLAPVAGYDVTIGSVGTQEYPSSISRIDYNLNSPQLPPEQKFAVNGEVRPAFGSNDQGLYASPAYQGGNGFVSGTVLPGSQSSNIAHSISTSAAPKDISSANYPYTKYGSDIEVTIPTAATPTSNFYFNQQSSDSFKPQKNLGLSSSQDSQMFDGGNIYSQSSYGPSKIGASSTLSPNGYAESTSSTPRIISLSEYSSTPIYSSEDLNFNKIQLPERSQADGDRNAVILNYENTLTPEGFAYSFDTSNNIHADESGTAVNGVKAQGSYSYVGDDGKLYRIVYTADENGFLPQGDHLPTAPPVPNAILKVIEQAAKNKELGIIDDGSYDDAKYGHGRYKGLMDVPTSRGFHNFVRKQPGYKSGREPNNEIGLDKNFGQVNIDNKADIMFERPYDGHYEDKNSRTNTEIEPAKGNDQLSSLGYDYNVPEGIINEENGKNKFGQEIRNDVTNAKPIITPTVSYKSKNVQESGVLQPSKQNFNRPNAPIYYKKDSENTSNEGTVTTDGVLSTRGPELGSTISGTYNYQSPNIQTTRKNEEKYDPTATLESQYTLATTPLPSEFTSRKFAFKGDSYPGSTPITSQFTSTLRPSFASDVPGSVPQKSKNIAGYQTQEEPFSNVKIQTTRPGFFNVVEKTEYNSVSTPGSKTENKDYSQEDSRNGFSEIGLRPNLGVSDPEQHNFKISSPKTYEGPSSTERLIGEDFRGPKQPQRFDPEHGYYY